MRRVASCLIVLLGAPILALAHGLLLDADVVGDDIVGTVYYSNGELAVHESVELLDLSVADAAPVAGKTDDDGKFSFPVTANHRYRISAYGEEGHGVDVELEAKADSRPRLVDSGAAEHDESWLPPAWAVIGGILLLSLVPAVLSRRRRTPPQDTSI